jgi:hypothetical protein
MSTISLIPHPSGWAVAVGWLSLMSPSTSLSTCCRTSKAPAVIFGNIQSRAYFIFGSLNLIWLVVIYFFLPETKDRPLESIVG